MLFRSIKFIFVFYFLIIIKKMRNTKSAFTLVELIVVITILAILGTIAFISLQGYSADARNSKRISDLGNIQSAMTLKQVEGTPLASFVSSNTDALGTINLAGQAAVASGTTYTAGNPSYSVLNVVADDFKDPSSDQDYKIGMTSLRGGSFQIGASMENDSGGNTALVNGSYVARATTAQNATLNGNVATMANASANFFKVNDYVVDSQSATGTVTKVARDGITVTLSFTATGTTLGLIAAESAGLIDSDTTPGTAVTNNGTNLPY